MIPKSLRNRNTIDLIWQLFRTDFKLRYNDSVMGFLWVLMKPFSIFLILYFVLTVIFPSQIENFPVYLLIGNVFVTFWSDGTNMGLDSLLSRAGLITKVNFPRYIVLISSTAISVVNFLINSMIISIFVILHGLRPGPIQILWYFVCAIILYLLILAVSMFISLIYVRFRDLKQIWELFNQILFWLTPVFYSYQVVAENSEILRLILFWLNPVSVLLISARAAIIENDIKFQTNVFVVAAVILIFLKLGYIFYKKYIKKIAEYF